MKSRFEAAADHSTSPPRGAWGCGNRRRGKGGGAKVEKDGKAASISRQRAVPTPIPSLPASFHHRPAHLHLKRSLDHHHSDILLLNPQATSPAAMSSRTPFQVAVPKSPCDSVCVFRLSLKATLFGITPERGGTISKSYFRESFIFRLQ